jgi:peptide/nickel transport system ATP-binding protein
VSALDVSIQAQILNLLRELQRELNISYIFISHDIGVVNYMSDTILVMQNGNIVERGEAKEVLLHPKKEYTKTLIESAFVH